MVKKLIAFFMFVFVCASLYPHGFNRYLYNQNDGKLRQVLRTTRAKVYDRDGDGLVNCIDYTITFKKEWDKVLPPCNCEIVRNYRKEGFREIMNHLFVRVKLPGSSTWIYVEPQARAEYDNYIMGDFWSVRYDPKYNNLGETYFWLGECRR